MGFDICRQPRPQGQILDLDNPGVAFLAAFDDGDGAVAGIGVFQLFAHIAATHEHFRTDPGIAQFRDHGHVVADPVLIHHCDHHGAGGLPADAALFPECRQQAINTDGNPGCRHFLTGKAFDQIIIAPAAGHRSKLPLPALFIENLERQFGLKNRPGIISKPAHDRWVNDDPVRTVALFVERFGNGFQFRDASRANVGTCHKIAQRRTGGRSAVTPRCHKTHDDFRLIRRQACARGKIAAGVLSALAQKRAHAIVAQPIQLVDGAQNDAPFGGLCICIAKTGGLHNTVQDLAVVDPHNAVTSRNAHNFQRVGKHCANFGICGHIAGANGIGVALIELPVAPGSRFFVAPHRPHGKAPIGRRQVVSVLGKHPGKRRGQIIPQRHPRLVLVLPGKDTLVRTIHIRQEFSQRLDRFHRRCFQRIKSVSVINLGNRGQHCGAFDHILSEIVTKPLGGFRPGSPDFLLVLGHFAASKIRLKKPRAFPIAAGQAGQGNCPHMCRTTQARDRPAPPDCSDCARQQTLSAARIIHSDRDARP